MADPRQDAGIARYLPLQSLAKQLGDFGRFSAAAHAAKELLRKMKGFVLTHRYLMFCMCACRRLTIRVSDGRQPPLPFECPLSETAASRSLHPAGWAAASSPKE